MTAGDFEPIPRRKLYQEVVERLVSRISRGIHAPGDKLPSERELMSQFGVGRPAVREAMQSLEQMGLISISHGERAIVTTPDAHTVLDQVATTVRHILLSSTQTLEHLKEARLLFEVAMVRIAAETATEDDIARLRERLDAHHQSLEDLSRFLEMDKLFHREVASVSRNPIYAAISQAIFEWLEAFHVELVRAEGAENVTLEEHDAIFEAIAARDPEAAVKAMERHLKRANKVYRQLERAAGPEKKNVL